MPGVKIRIGQRRLAVLGERDRRVGVELDKAQANEDKAEKYKCWKNQFAHDGEYRGGGRHGQQVGNGCLRLSRWLSRRDCFGPAKSGTLAMTLALALVMILKSLKSRRQ